MLGRARMLRNEPARIKKISHIISEALKRNHAIRFIHLSFYMLSSIQKGDVQFSRVLAFLLLLDNHIILLYFYNKQIKDFLTKIF